MSSRNYERGAAISAPSEVPGFDVFLEGPCDVSGIEDSATHLWLLGSAAGAQPPAAATFPPQASDPCLGALPAAHEWVGVEQHGHATRARYLDAVAASAQGIGCRT